MIGRIVSNAVGKRNIPRFIYHMTSARNYESILKDGCIKPTPDELLGNGVFATELTNLFKRWRVHKNWDNYSLQEQLIQQVSKGRDDIVILKIPTSSLDKDKLVVRSQNKLFGIVMNDKFSQIFRDIDTKFVRRDDVSGWLSSLRSYFKRSLQSFEKQEVIDHVTLGSPVSKAKHFKRKKDAIEYVYQDKIPVGNVEKIGQVNIAELRKTSDYDPVRPMKSIFSALLSGTPEQKGALLLNC